MAEDRSDLDSVFGSEDNETHKYETNGKRIQTNRNKKSTRSSKRDTLRYSSESPTGRVNKYPPLSATKSETATLRPVTASASVMYGLPEVQDYVPRPVTTSEVSRKKGSKSRRSVKDCDRESKSSDDNEDEEFGHQNRHVSFANLHSDLEEKSLNSSLCNPSVRTKSSTMVLKHLHESLDELIDEEDELFKNKYSEWISELFHNELKALRKKLRTQFHLELEELVASHEADLDELEEKYHEKLMEFEQSSQSFRDWLDALEDENRHLQSAKDWETGQLREDNEVLQRNLESQLEKQRSQMQAEHNREMERLIRDHERQLAHATGQSAVCGQLNSLRRTVSNLKSQNIELQKKISSGVCDVGSDLNRTIEDLRDRLDQAELEKINLCQLHDQQMSELKDAADKNISKLQALLATSQEAIDAFKKAHDEEVESLRNSLNLQEMQFNKTLSTLQSKYGSKIESLTDMIDKIQNNQAGQN